MDFLTRAIIGSDSYKAPKPDKRPSLMTENEKLGLASLPGDWGVAAESRADWTMEDWDILISVKGAKRHSSPSRNLPGPLSTLSQYAKASGRRAYERGERWSAHPICFTRMTPLAAGLSANNLNEASWKL